MSEIIDQIKGYLIAALGLATAVFAILFFWEKDNAAASKALLNNQKLDADIQKSDEIIAQNNQAIKEEQTKQSNLEKVNTDATVTDIADFLANRK